jgi:hypothetical protein
MASRGSETTRAFRPAPFFDHGLFLLHLNRGKEEMARGHHEAARREFDEAQRLRPQDPEVLLNPRSRSFTSGSSVRPRRRLASSSRSMTTPFRCSSTSG